MKDNEITASMPSNIALIKYMGKSSQGKNRPANSSLSWTMPHLSTTVKLVAHERDEWQPLPSDFPLSMSEKSQQRYLAHLQFLRQELKGQQNFLVSSGNNFPSDCGVASSASSFAALTQAACEAFAPETSLSDRAHLSSLGSGSSCRSFMPGWVMWNGSKVAAIKSPYAEMLHMVVVVAQSKKKVSSSEAHQRVQSSLLFNDRVLRAEIRLRAFVDALSEQDWEFMHNIAWAEFWDMHALFESSQPSFGYFEPATISVLQQAREYWHEQKDGPLVTMDAGANVHLLWRKDQEFEAVNYFNNHIRGHYIGLTNIEDIGFVRV